MWLEFLDTDVARSLAYGLAGGLALVWYVRERRGGVPEHWPRYWLLSALVLVTMGITRLGGVGELFSELGREQARSSGWYEDRRGLQAFVVAAVAGVWFVSVLVAIWRVPPRRRYLPHAVVVSAVAAFAFVRLVSLHQIDGLLYRRDVAGARVVALVEVMLLACVVPATLGWARFPSRATPAGRGPGRSGPEASVSRPAGPPGGPPTRER
jgi:hypothetical protein